MDWDEFTNYIIEKAAVLNTLKSKSEEIKSYQTNKVKAPLKLLNPIAKCIYVNLIDKLAFFEEGSDLVYFADPKTGQIVPNMVLHVRITP